MDRSLQIPQEVESTYLEDAENLFFIRRSPFRLSVQ